MRGILLATGSRRGGFVLAMAGLSAIVASVPAGADEVEFGRRVIPVLTKLGCNAGACHGSFQGRGGFRLSLLGFDPVADFHALTREARGRRIFPASPGQSLLLRKAVAAIPHGGGRRLDPDSEAYRLIRDWIACGTPAPRPDGPTVSRLEVVPADASLAPGQNLEIRVDAHWSDGRVEDVTRWALYESNDDRVAGISPQGLLTTHAPGRLAVTVRYLGRVAAIPVTVPYPTPADGPAPAVVDNPIDRQVAAEWAKLAVRPAPLCDDAEFVRRVSLDLTGTLPTADEARSFLKSTDPGKRARWIDALLDRPAYVDFWTLKWADLLHAHRRSLGDKGLASFQGWMRQAIRVNRPADAIARALLTAQGNLYKNGAAAFFYNDQTPNDLAETTAQVFLGLRLQCARCHHHPFEVWSQDDYYGLAAFFARVQRKDTKEGGSFGGAQSVRLAATGTVTHPNTNQPVAPRLLGSVTTQIGAEQDPRAVLADWITAKANPFFARNVVNRYWGYLFGRGIVEPIDDLRATNPPSHPALLDALAEDFIKHGYDLKWLLRALCNTRAYQLASELDPDRDADGKLFTHHRPRRLPAEVLLDALNQAAETSEAFDELPAGTRAIALPDPAVKSYFLDTFGRPRRASTCECERGARPDLSQVLHLINSNAVHRKVSDPKGRVARLLATTRPDAEIVEDLYLATLSRSPSPDERETVRGLLASAPSRKEGFEDLLWTLLNLAEFAFNH